MLSYARLQQLIKAIGVQPIRYVPRVEVYLYILYACILRLHSGSWRIGCSPACYYVDLQVYLDSYFCCLHRIVRFRVKEASPEGLALGLSDCLCFSDCLPSFKYR